MIPLVLVGAAGRMGKAVEEAAATADDLYIKAKLDPAAPEIPGSRPGSTGYPQGGPGPAAIRGAAAAELSRVLAAGDVVIEFSSPQGARASALACAERGAALVSGTTGLAAEDEAAMRAAAERVAVLRAANFSLGVSALRRALAAALAMLAATPGWDVEIVERHHRRKLDSPSGTALVLAREAMARLGLPESALRMGRQGKSGPRPHAEVGVHSVRGGTWVGDHAVLIAGEGEWLELRHVAESRAAFAHGALTAARFVARSAPGLYALEDIGTPPGRTVP